MSEQTTFSLVSDTKMEDDRVILQLEESKNEINEIKGEFSDKLESESCRKRKRLNVEEEKEEENDGFKTPTRPENRIPEIKECPPAPRRPKPEFSRRFSGKPVSCRRRLNFVPEETIISFIRDLEKRKINK